MSEVILCEGKYRFYKWDNGILRCQRYTREWRDFVGDHAICALYDEVIRLKLELDAARSALRDARIETVQTAMEGLRTAGKVLLGQVSATDGLRSIGQDVCNESKRVAVEGDLIPMRFAYCSGCQLRVGVDAHGLCVFCDALLDDSIWDDFI